MNGEQFTTEIPCAPTGCGEPPVRVIACGESFCEISWNAISISDIDELVAGRNRDGRS